VQRASSLRPSCSRAAGARRCDEAKQLAQGSERSRESKSIKLRRPSGVRTDAQARAWLDAVSCSAGRQCGDSALAVTLVLSCCIGVDRAGRPTALSGAIPSSCTAHYLLHVKEPTDATRRGGLQADKPSLPCGSAEQSTLPYKGRSLWWPAPGLHMAKPWKCGP
jgi:hypothetical protein